MYSDFYLRNKARAKIKTVGPTETDQSQAQATDLNVIVQKFGVTVRSPNAEPKFGMDLTTWPQDLRETFEVATSLRDARRQLPSQLQDLAVAELLKLTPEEILARLKPADKPSDAPKDEPKS